MSKRDDLRAELDKADAEAVALDAEIAERRERLTVINKRRGELEKEFQHEDALEAQAKQQQT